MENQTPLITDELLSEQPEFDSTVVDTEPSPEVQHLEITDPPELMSEAEPTPVVEPELTELEKLINKRTGYWQVNMEPADLKWVKNACQGKFGFTGPNQAFMLMNCYLGFSGAIARQEQNQAKELPVLQASAIESCALLINSYSSSGLESAQRIFRIAIALNNVVMEMKNLDEVINGMKEAEKKEVDQKEPA